MRFLSDLKIRLRARGYGRLRNNPLLSELAAVALLVRSGLPGRSTRRRLEDLLTASRRATTGAIRRALRRRIAPRLEGAGSSVWRSQQVGLGRYLGKFGDVRDRVITTSVVLKAPGPDGEKGVLYSSFEYNWLRLAQHERIREFLRDYYLVGASSWSPPDYVPFVHLAGLSDDPVFIGISNKVDMERYRIASPAIEPVDLMACDWINPEYYAPRPRAERSIDILMVANWLRFKRHWLLFEALRHMRRDLRVVLVGRNGPGRTEREIREEARAFGVPQDLELHTNISIVELTRLQCDTRIGVLFSGREGSCVAPVETLFADAPVAMMQHAHVGSRAYINPRTGIIVRRSNLDRTLGRFLEESDGFSPRAWALENVTCHHSSARLNALLREHATHRGQPWTTDIAPLCWRYVPQLVREADVTRLARATSELAERYGIALKTYPRDGM